MYYTIVVYTNKRDIILPVTFIALITPSATMTIDNINYMIRSFVIIIVYILYIILYSVQFC